MKSKKHLSFTALRKTLSQDFHNLPESRQDSKINYSIHDAMMSGFACMFFQDPSLLAFQERLKDHKQFSNLQTVFGVKDIPKDNQMRTIIDEVDSDCPMSLT